MGQPFSKQTRNLLIGSPELTEQKLINGLHQTNCALTTCSYSNLSETLAKSPEFDTLLFDASGFTSQEQLNTCLKLAERIKAHQATTRMRLLLIGIPSGLMQDLQPHQFDDLLFGEIKLPPLLSRMKAQTRLNTMQAEFERRTNIAERYHCDTGLKNPLGEEISDASILITGRPNGYKILEETLTPISTLIGTLSLNTAGEYLKRQKFDMIIINGGKTPTRFFDFITEIRNNASLFNVPILLVAGCNRLANSHIAFEAGVTDIISAPLNRNELILRTNSLIKERRFRSMMSQPYLSARHIPTNDALTGLFNYSYFHQHLEKLIEDQRTTQTSFTLIKVRIENITEINEEYGFAAGDTTLRQVSEILMSIIRGEDLASRISGNKFLLTLPDTASDHAVNVLKRVEGILKKTQFICETDCSPISVELAAEIIESDKSQSLNDLMQQIKSLSTSNNAIIAA